MVKFVKLFLLMIMLVIGIPLELINLICKSLSLFFASLSNGIESILNVFLDTINKL
jgi:hypothetical protein